MDYSELLFALKVREIARGRMIKDIHDKNEKLSVKEVMEKMKDLDYSSYAKNVLSDAEETAGILKE